jgi:hypothetical protein
MLEKWVEIILIISKRGICERKIWVAIRFWHGCDVNMDSMMNKCLGNK